MTTINVSGIEIASNAFYDNQNISSVDCNNVSWENNSLSSYSSDGFLQGAFYNCRNLSHVYNFNENITNSAYAFYLCTNMVGPQSIPENTTNMYGTFAGCWNLTTAPSIPNNVINMYAAFSACFNLKSAPTIPDSVIDMSYCFSNCNTLYSIHELPSSVISLNSTFYNCYNLKTAPAIPANAKDLYCMFWGCNNLTSAPTIPNGVEKIYGMFSGSLITDAPEIPESVTNLEATFWNCTRLKNVTNIPTNVDSIRAYFYGCSNIKTSPAIPANVKNIASTFYNCINLSTTPIIPSNVTNMWGTFNNCTNLRTPPNLTYCKDIFEFAYAFQNCTNLTGDIYIGSATIENAYRAFYGTSKTKNVYIPFNTTTYYSFLNAGYKTNSAVNGVTLKEHPDSITDGDWKMFIPTSTIIGYSGSSSSITIPSTIQSYTVDSVSPSAFKGNNNITSIDFNNINTSGSLIGSFSNLSNLEYLNNTVFYSKNCSNAFINCYNLKGEITIYETLNLTNAFTNCQSLEKVTLINENPMNMYSLPANHAFCDCHNLKEVEGRIEYYWINNCFMNCYNLTNTPIMTINNFYNGFRNCVNLVHCPNIHLENNDLRKVFRDCHKLEEIPEFVNNSNIYIEKAFMNCYSLKNVPNLSQSEYLNMAFCNCYNMKGTIDLGNNVWLINSSFSNCYNIQGSINLPNSLKWAKEGFQNCRNINSVPVITENIIDLRKTFDGCVNLSGDILFTNNELTGIQDCFNNTSAIKNVYLETSVTEPEIYTLTCYDGIYEGDMWGPSPLSASESSGPSPIGGSGDTERMQFYIKNDNRNAVYDSNGIQMLDYGFSYWSNSIVKYYSEEVESEYEEMEEYEKIYTTTRNTAGDIIVNKSFGSNSDLYKAFLLEGYSLTERKNGVLLKEYLVTYNLNINVNDYDLFINKGLANSSTIKIKCDSISPYLIYKDGYCLNFGNIITNKSDASKIKDLNISLSTSGDTYTINLDQEAQIKFIYNDVNFKTTIENCSSIIVPEGTEINYEIFKEGFIRCSGTLTSSNKTVNLTLVPVVINTYTLTYPFTGSGSSYLNNLVKNNQFIISSGSGTMEASICSGSSSYNVNNGLSYGYIEFTTPDTYDTNKLTVTVEVACSSQKYYDVGWVYIGKELTEPTNSNMRTSSPSSSFGAVLFNSYSVNDTTYNSYTMVLEPATKYYLQFRYSKNNSTNSGWDRLSIKSITFTTVE